MPNLLVPVGTVFDDFYRHDGLTKKPYPCWTGFKKLRNLPKSPSCSLLQWIPNPWLPANKRPHPAAPHAIILGKCADSPRRTSQSKSFLELLMWDVNFPGPKRGPVGQKGHTSTVAGTRALLPRGLSAGACALRVITTWRGGIFFTAVFFGY